jgi:hypothetical protein
MECGFLTGGVTRRSAGTVIRGSKFGDRVVDVACAYLRLPYDPDPGEDAAPGEGTPMRVREAYRAERSEYR